MTQGIDKIYKYDAARFDIALGTAGTFMSNFWQLKIPIVDMYGNEYWNSEGMYMALRTNSKLIKMLIATDSVKGGKESRKARRLYELDQDELKRVKYMQMAVKAKFDYNPDLCEQLIQTGDAEIIEKNHWGDTLFGVSTTTLRGANMLGKILMRYRELYI
jgi:predicted NAD-dependent protein-ADP-ribosyltransferase YbiA (DUF1768 family)